MEKTLDYNLRDISETHMPNGQYGMRFKSMLKSINLEENIKTRIDQLYNEISVENSETIVRLVRVENNDNYMITFSTKKEFPRYTSDLITSSFSDLEDAKNDNYLSLLPLIAKDCSGYVACDYDSIESYAQINIRNGKTVIEFKDLSEIKEGYSTEFGIMFSGNIVQLGQKIRDVLDDSRYNAKYYLVELNRKNNKWEYSELKEKKYN